LGGEGREGKEGGIDDSHPPTKWRKKMKEENLPHPPIHPSITSNQTFGVVHFHTWLLVQVFKMNEGVSYLDPNHEVW
jgi:hypothetical protein